MRQAYGECRCGKWAEAPEKFIESKHFMVCSCGQDMFLMHGKPESYNTAANKTKATVRNHNG